MQLEVKHMLAVRYEDWLLVLLHTYRAVSYIWQLLSNFTKIAFIQHTAVNLLVIMLFKRVITDICQQIATSNMCLSYGPYRWWTPDPWWARQREWPVLMWYQWYICKSSGTGVCVYHIAIIVQVPLSFRQWIIPRWPLSICHCYAVVCWRRLLISLW